MPEVGIAQIPLRRRYEFQVDGFFDDARSADCVGNKLSSSGFHLYGLRRPPIQLAIPHSFQINGDPVAPLI